MEKYKYYKEINNGETFNYIYEILILIFSKIKENVNISDGISIMLTATGVFIAWYIFKSTCRPIIQMKIIENEEINGKDIASGNIAERRRFFDLVLINTGVFPAKNVKTKISEKNIDLEEIFNKNYNDKELKFNYETIIDLLVLNISYLPSNQKNSGLLFTMYKDENREDVFGLKRNMDSKRFQSMKILIDVEYYNHIFGFKYNDLIPIYVNYTHNTLTGWSVNVKKE